MFWRLNDFVAKRQLGRVITNDGGVQTEHDPDTVRGADVAYYSYERVPRGPLPKGYWPAPELVVEVKSSDDRGKTIHKKVGEHLDAGVLTVIVIDPDKQLIHVTTPDRETETRNGDTDYRSHADSPGVAAGIQRAGEGRLRDVSRGPCLRCGLVFQCVHHA
jgi:Uma2 family endonuclease